MDRAAIFGKHLKAGWIGRAWPIEPPVDEIGRPYKPNQSWRDSGEDIGVSSAGHLVVFEGPQRIGNPRTPRWNIEGSLNADWWKHVESKLSDNPHVIARALAQLEQAQPSDLDTAPWIDLPAPRPITEKVRVKVRDSQDQQIVRHLLDGDPARSPIRRHWQ